MPLKGSKTSAVATGALEGGIRAYFPKEQWGNAVDIAFMESKLNQWAVNDSLIRQARGEDVPGAIGGVAVSPELSIGPFQINVVTCPADWDWPTLFDPWVNAWAAHELWAASGWSPWYFSATRLGLV